MIGEVRFTYEASDVSAIRRASWMGAAHWRKPAMGFVTVFLFFFLIMGGDEVLTGGSMVVADAEISATAAALLITLSFGRSFLSSLTGSKRVLRSNPLMRDEQHICWDDQALHICSTHGHADLPWELLAAWQDSPKVILFYHARSLAAAVSKRALGVGEAEQLVMLVREHLPERKRLGIVAAKG